MNFGISYFGNRMPWYVKEDLLKLKSAGFKTIVHTYSENDFQFYRETMREIAQISKQLGFEIWADPWGWGGVFGGEAFSGFLQRNMEEAQVGNDGKRKGSVCFRSEKFKDYMKQWIDAVKEAGFDAIFWDEPHFYIPYPYSNFPSVWTCRCEKCKEAFKSQYGYEIPEVYNQDVSDFRHETAFQFFAEMSSYAKEKGLENVICFLPKETDLFGIKDFESLAKLETIDDIGTDPYWMAFNLPMEPFVSETTERIKELSEKYNKTSHIWIQGFRVPKGREEELKDGFQIIKSLGIRHVLFWGVYACKHMSHIAPEDPDRTWQVILQIVCHNS